MSETLQRTVTRTLLLVTLVTGMLALRPAAAQEGGGPSAWTGLDRLSVSLVGFGGVGSSYGYYNGLAEHYERHDSTGAVGLLLDYEHVGRNGFYIGVHWSPSIYFTDIFASNGPAELYVGYARENFAVALAAGTGVPVFSLGAVARIGRFDRVHLNLRYLVSPLPGFPSQIPALAALGDAEVDLDVPLSRRLHLDLRGSAWAFTEFSASAGLHVYLGPGITRKATVLRAEAGLYGSFLPALYRGQGDSTVPVSDAGTPFLGPLFRLGVERRF